MPKTRHCRCVRGGTWRSRKGRSRGLCGGSDSTGRGGCTAPLTSTSLIRLGSSSVKRLTQMENSIQRHVERGEAAQEVRSLVAQRGAGIGQTEMRKAFEHTRDRN